jgi:hypothetical protein
MQNLATVTEVTICLAVLVGALSFGVAHWLKWAIEPTRRR